MTYRTPALGPRFSEALGPPKLMVMDADLFDAKDMSALLAIRAVIANRRVSAAELRALFSSTGLLHDEQANRAAVGVVRALAPADRRG